MTRMNITLIAAVLVLSGALALPANPQNQIPPRPTPKLIETPPNGRYQIVNGTPDLTRNIMLLDTQTGDSWIDCDDDGRTTWCRILRSNAPTANNQPSLLGEPSGASDGATTVSNGVRLVSKDGKWQLP